MNLQQIAEKLNLKLLTHPADFSKVYPSAGYTSDLLSCVIANATHKGIWVTLQAHSNIVAVAALLELSAIIITEGAEPDAETLEKANEEGIPLFVTDKSTFNVVGHLWELGLRA